MVQQYLCPGNETQGHEDLGLNLKGYIEVLSDSVYSKWKTGSGGGTKVRLRIHRGDIGCVG